MIRENIVIHHTASSRDFTSLKDVDNWHRARGFPQSQKGYFVGYHYLILHTGQVVQTRNDWEIGAHAKDNNMNFRSIGIALTGNFEEEHPTEEQLSALKKLLVEKLRAFNLTRDKVIAHNEVIGATTLCCGKNLIKWLKDYRTQDLSYLQVQLNKISEMLKRLKVAIAKLGRK